MDFSFKKYLFYLKWPLLGIGALLFNKLLHLFPWIAEKVYFRFFFQIWRVIYDYTLGLLPFGTVYIFFFLLLIIFYYIFIQPWRSDGAGIKSMAYRLVNFLSIFVLLFYLMWGYNYNRDALAIQLGINKVNVEEASLDSEINMIVNQLDILRENIKKDSSLINDKDVPDRLTDHLRDSQEKVLQSWDFPTYGRVKVVKLIPKGILLRISTAGVYIPFVSEGHIDKGLHPIQWPFTMAHEMAHGYGFTDEGECNFIAFVTCLNTENDFIKYSGMMGYLRYLLSNYRRYNHAQYNQLLDTIPHNVLVDLKAIDQESMKYPDILPKVRDVVYDQYLKSHGIKEGLSSYSTIIRLIYQWRNSNHNKDLVRRIFPWLKHE